MRLANLIRVLFSLLPVAVLAQQMVPATGEFRVNQNVPSDQFLPQVAVGPSDDYIVVWKSWMQDDNTASIYFRRYNSAHIALSPELLVATGSTYTEGYVVKAVYWTAGKFIIAWNDASNVNMRVLNTDNTMSAIVPLAGNGQWDIAVRGNSLVILYGSGNEQLYIRGYDLGTNSFIAPAVLATESGADDYEMPNIRYRSDGSLVAIYARAYPSRIYRKTFDSDLLAQINETTVYDAPTISLSCIDVSTNASDEILISTKWGVNGTDVYKAWVLDATGTPIVDNLGVYSCAYAYYTSECALFDNGDFVIVMGNWLSLNDTENYNVRGIYFSDYAFQSTGVVVMNTTIPDVQAYPAVEKRSDGSFVVVWEGNGFQGDVQGINARVWSGASFPGVQPTSTAVLITQETGTSQLLELRLGTQPTGDVVVDLSVSDATEGSIDVAQMTFTTANWDQTQPVIVTGADDILDDGNIGFNVVATMNAATADAQYAAMGPEYFGVNNLDDDATVTMPLDQSFCRDIGLASINVLVSNVGSPVGSPTATSSDQAVVADADITIQQVNATTFEVSISGLADNVPGPATITVTVTDGLFDYGGSFQVTTLGAVPVITQDGVDLTVNPPGVSYQWYLNGAFIPAGTQQTWTTTQNGTYSVLVVDANGCYSTSADLVFNSTGIAATQASALQIGPWHEMLMLTAREAGMLLVLDVNGKEAGRTQVRAGTQWLSLPDLASGMYILKLGNELVRAVKP